MAGKIDFSMIDRIAYQGFTTEAQREERDSILQAGYMFVDSPENPFTAPQPSAQPKPQPKPQPEPLQPQGGAPERKREAFTDHSGGRDYNKLYRVVHDYHKKHSPPVVDTEYWRTHTQGLDETPEAELKYWEEAAADAGETSTVWNDDPFLMALLIGVLDELEREYKALREEASRRA